MSWHVRAAVRSSRGLVRGSNEDNFYFHGHCMALERMDEGCALAYEGEDEVQLYAVCDGLGGESAGEQAATLVAGGLRALEDDPVPPRERMLAAARRANEALCGLRRRRLAKMGTTLSLMLLADGRVNILHVGDSRVYRLRGGALERMTRDHSQRRSAGDCALLTQYVGLFPEEVTIAPDAQTGIAFDPEDTWLICSDGLSDMVPDKRIERILGAAGDVRAACDALVRAALEAGGADNITAIVVRGASRRDGERPPLGRRIGEMLRLRRKSSERAST